MRHLLYYVSNLFLTIFQVKVILEPSLQNECIEAQLYTYGCHGDGTCPTVSHTQRSGAEETYLLFNVVSSFSKYQAAK